MGPTEAVARWIRETNYESIPSDAVKMAQEVCFDCLGVLLAGSVQPHGRIFTRYIEGLGGRAEATVLPRGFRTSACNAALGNGTLSHVLDYDDSGAFSHPSCVLFPALLALGEKMDVSGRDLIEAYVVGCEVGTKLASSYPNSRGFHKMAVFGRMASTSACAKLLHLDERQIRMALGIASSMASGLVSNHGTMTKPLHGGLAARDGLMAAELAAQGWTAGEDIVEHAVGLIATFCGKGADVSGDVKSLGKPFITHDAITIKKYPCGGGNHPTLDSVLSLIEEHHFDYRDVEEIEVQQSYQSHYVLYGKPCTGLEGKFSIVYTTAAALVQGKVDIDTFTDDRVRDPRIQEAMDKVRVRLLSRWEEWEDRISRKWPTGSTGFTGRGVRIRLKDGRLLTKTISPKEMLGSPQNPWGFENVRVKFESNASLALPTEKVEEAVRLWSKIVEVKKIREAIACVVGGEGHSLEG